MTDDLPPPRAAKTRDLWPSSGFRLLSRTGDGRLAVTDDFLRAYLMRPEVAPVEESCDRERALHERLMSDPRMPVAEADIEAMADDDARDNYRVVLAFRDRLLAAGSIEAAYLSVFEEARVTVPPLFVDQMAEVVVRNILDGTDDPFRARAGELLFREQSVTVQDGAILAGDTETIEMLATTGGMGDLGRLVVDAGTRPREVDLDVLQPETAGIYWNRDERHDTVLDLSFSRPGLDALCRVLEGWVGHFTGADVAIQPVQKITDEKWVWHIGLDVEASRFLDDLYNGVEVDEARNARLLSLFRLEFRDPSLMAEPVRGRPVYLGMCMTEAKRLKLKPQNLLVNLPLAPDQ